MRAGPFVAVCALISVPSAHAGWWPPWSNPNPSPNPNPQPSSPWGGGGGGQGAAETSYETKTNLLCRTLQGFGSPGGLPTQTITQQITLPFPLYAQSTSIPIVHITPNPVHVIQHVTSLVTTTIQPPPIVSVFSTTSTILESVLSTISPPLATITTIVGTTSTVYTSTSTIPASGGFLGVLETGLPSISKAKREELLELDREYEELARREYEELAELESRQFWGGSSNSGNNGGLLGQLLHGVPGLPGLGGMRSINHPSLTGIQVTCISQILVQEIITTVVIGPAQTITAAAMTVTSTETTIHTSTSTLAPSHITETSSFSVTSIISSTTTLPQSTLTSTSTTSATISIPTTVYGACGASNLLGPALPALFGAVAGDLITDVFYNPSNLLLMTSPGATAYDCCAQCISETAAGCAFGAWDPSGTCFLHYSSGNTCPAQSVLVGQYVVKKNPTSVAYEVYNGYCGSLAYGGLEKGKSS